MAGKKKVDAVSEAALSTVETQIKREQIKEAEQKKREKLIAQTYRMMGRIETADVFGKLATVASLVWLKDVKESKIYKDIDGMGSWESFCNHLGKSRRKIDEDLQNLNVFGKEFLATVASFKVGYKDLRKLQGSVKDGGMIIEGEFVVIGEEKIPLTPDSKDDLEAAFETLVEERDRKLENNAATLKAKDRVLEAKEKIINRQEKELLKFTRQIKARGFEPGEENFIRDMENLKTTLVGMELKMDARNMPPDMTPLMRAAYIETLGHFKRTIIAHYDEATNHYGIDDDEDWIPPHERSSKDDIAEIAE